jgi:hypothetical protein
MFQSLVTDDHNRSSSGTNDTGYYCKVRVPPGYLWIPVTQSEM